MASYNPYEQKILGYERQQKLAEQLRNTQMPEGQMIGQHYVAANPLAQIGAALRGYAGLEMEDKAQKGIEQTRQEQGQALKDWQAQMPTTRTEEMAGPYSPEQGIQAPARTTKPTAEDYMAWGQQGLAIDPTAAQMGVQNAQIAMTREQNAENAKARIYENQVKRQEDYAQQERMLKMNLEGRGDIAKALKGMSVQGQNGQVKLSQTQQKELFESDELAQSSQNVVGMLNQALQLNNEAYSGPLAKQRATGMSWVSNDPRAQATIELDNIMTGQALEGLKAAFGGNPTEGERKIMLELQASSDKTPEVRKAIIERAIGLANRRAQFNAQKADAIRTGQYGQAGYSPVMQPTQVTQPQSNGGWSIRPAGGK